ncbi:MAG: AmmeMemoRadiSam system protein B [Balneolaceae bacterium]|nr:MAG: AmmeMemoRadiSam system protein B [Balneolaceae bacterium]
MNITSFKREQIEEGLMKARNHTPEPDETVRLMFSPFEINNHNFDEACLIYSRLEKNNYDTVVVVESHPGSASKKLPMPSFKFLKTPLGDVNANDKLRNDFADEDDDFFIDDEAFDDDVSLYNQLMMLQTALDGFEILSIQITDENSFIVRELAFAIEEILASKNALVVFCCDLDASHTEELNRVKHLFDTGNESGLMNYLNGGNSNIKGVSSFVTGLLVAKKWGLKIHFPAFSENEIEFKNLISGYAVMKLQPVF